MVENLHNASQDSYYGKMDPVRQLFDACAEGNVTAVLAFLDGELGVDATDDDDTTALQVHVKCYYSFIFLQLTAVTKMLIRNFHI